MVPLFPGSQSVGRYAGKLSNSLIENAFIFENNKPPNDITALGCPSIKWNYSINQTIIRSFGSEKRNQVP